MCISAIIILIFFIPYTASGFKAIGTLFSSLFGTDYHIAMIIGAVVIVGYTVMGGFMAVSTTDLIQSVVMSISLIVIVFYGIHMAGGWNEVVNNATSLAGYLSMTQLHDRAAVSAAPYSLLSIISTLAWGLGYFGMPHILLRFMAIEEEKKLVLSRRIATVWVLISMCVAILIGIIGYGASVAGSIPMFTTSSQSETVIIQFAHLLGQNGFLLSLIAGVVLAGDVYERQSFTCGLTPEFSAQVLPYILPTFKQRHPNVELHFIEEHNEKLIQLLKEEKIELAIVYVYKRQPLIYMRLFQMDFWQNHLHTALLLF